MKGGIIVDPDPEGSHVGLARTSGTNVVALALGGRDTPVVGGVEILVLVLGLGICVRGVSLAAALVLGLCSWGLLLAAAPVLGLLLVAALVLGLGIKSWLLSAAWFSDCRALLGGTHSSSESLLYSIGSPSDSESELESDEYSTVLSSVIEMIWNASSPEYNFLDILAVWRVAVYNGLCDGWQVTVTDGLCDGWLVMFTDRLCDGWQVTFTDG